MGATPLSTVPWEGSAPTTLLVLGELGQVSSICRCGNEGREPQPQVAQVGRSRNRAVAPIPPGSRAEAARCPPPVAHLLGSRKHFLLKLLGLQAAKSPGLCSPK